MKLLIYAGNGDTIMQAEAACCIYNTGCKANMHFLSDPAFHREIYLQGRPEY